jgi:hypothetical protein
MKKLAILLPVLLVHVQLCFGQTSDDVDQFIAKYKSLSANYKSCQKEVELQDKRIQELELALKQAKLSNVNAQSSPTITSQKTISSYVDLTKVNASSSLQQEDDSITREVKGFGTYYAVQFGVKNESQYIGAISGVRLLGFNKSQQTFIYRIDNIDTYEKCEMILKNIQSTPLYSAYITKYINGEATNYYTFNNMIDKSTVLNSTITVAKPTSSSSGSTKSFNEKYWEYGTDENGNEKIVIDTKKMSTPKKDNYSVKMQPNWEYGTDENGQVKIIVKP